MFIVIVGHTPDWVNYVGPFKGEANALEWMGSHWLEDAKTEVKRLISPGST